MAGGPTCILSSKPSLGRSHSTVTAKCVVNSGKCALVHVDARRCSTWLSFVKKQPDASILAAVSAIFIVVDFQALE